MIPPQTRPPRSRIYGINSFPTKSSPAAHRRPDRIYLPHWRRSSRVKRCSNRRPPCTSAKTSPAKRRFVAERPSSTICNDLLRPPDRHQHAVNRDPDKVRLNRIASGFAHLAHELNTQISTWMRDSPDCYKWEVWSELWCRFAIPGGQLLLDAIRAGGFVNDRPTFRQKILSVHGDIKKRHESSPFATGKMFEFALRYWFCENRGYDRQRLERRLRNPAVEAEIYQSFLTELSAAVSALATRETQCG